MSEEWVSNSTPSVPPDDKFRQDLHRALEETHRQQMAQRKLGARPDQVPNPTNSRAFWLRVIVLLALLGLVAYAVSHPKGGRNDHT